MRIARSETITVRADEVPSYVRGVGQARNNRARSGNFTATGVILAGFVTSGSLSVPGFFDCCLYLLCAGQSREYRNGRGRSPFYRHNYQSWRTGEFKRLRQHAVLLQYAAVIPLGLFRGTGRLRRVFNISCCQLPLIVPGMINTVVIEGIPCSTFLLPDIKTAKRRSF